jgi:hypothetical protein
MAKPCLSPVSAGDLVTLTCVLGACLYSPGLDARAEVALSPLSATILKGDTVRFRAQAFDSTGRPIASSIIRWSSADRSVAAVDSDGLVRGTGFGTTRILVSVEAATGQAAVTVSPLVVRPQWLGLVRDDTMRLKGAAVDANGETLPDSSISWLSNDTNIALVDSAGLVTARRPGQTTVTTILGDVVREARVLVTEPILVGAGDIADCFSDGDEATATLLDSIPGIVFAAGDNAYPNGQPEAFANCYEPTWGRHKSRTRPALGNHEYDTGSAQAYFQYFGRSAGDPSKGYYSYDYHGWHVVVVNSMLKVSAGSPQNQWLRADLAAHPSQCTIAYFHYPLFSSGVWAAPHMRPVWEALHDAGAEIVVSGHDHVYERFAPQTPSGGLDPLRGIRQFTVGTGGGHGHHGWAPTPAPNSEVRDNTTFGVLKLTLYPGRYDWEFVPVAGGTFRDAGSGSCH